jgi:hypothetical protein
VTDGQWNLRRPDGAWITVGIPKRPIYLRNAENQWVIFGGGSGLDLNLRDKTPRWVRVSKGGMLTGIVYGQITDRFGLPLRNKKVYLMTYNELGTHYITYTDADGFYSFRELPFNPLSGSAHYYAVLAYQIFPEYMQNYGSIRVTELDPVQRYDFTFFERYKTLEIWSQNYYLNTGWSSAYRLVYEYNQRFTDRNKYTDRSGPISYMQASTYVGTGWTGDEFNTFSREKSEQIIWMVIPVGMFFLRQTEFINLEQATHPDAQGNESFWQFGRFTGVDLRFEINGSSAVKRQLSWMNFFRNPGTTLSPYHGTGSLRYMGQCDDPWELFYWEGATSVVNVPRNKPQTRETTGTVLWEGPINSVGGLTDSHGVNPNDPYVLNMHFDWDEIGFSTALLFHLYTSDLPEPPPFGGIPGGYEYYSIINELNVRWRLTYTWVAT